MGCGESKSRSEPLPSQQDLPGQNYLGSCWQLPKDANEDAVPTWARTCSGQLINRAFHVSELPKSDGSSSTAAAAESPTSVAPQDDNLRGRKAHRNRTTGEANGYLLPSVQCDADSLESHFSVTSDDDIKVKSKISAKLSVELGLGGVGVGGGAEKKKSHGTGSRDVYLVCTLETFRLSVDVAQAVWQQRRELENELEGSPAGQSSDPFDEASSARLSRRSSSGIALYEVDPTNSPAYGDGCVTQVKCGGQLVIVIKQTNFAKQIEAFGAGMEIGLSASGVRLGGNAKKKRQGGDQKLNADVRNMGGPELPKSLQNKTIAEIFEMVEAWADGLAEDSLLAVPIRVGVYRYSAMGSLLPTKSDPSPLIPPSHNGSPHASSFPNEAVTDRGGVAVVDDEELQKLRSRVAELEEQVKASEASAAAATVAAASINTNPSQGIDATDVDLLTSAIVPCLTCEEPDMSVSANSTANQRALARYVAKAVNGEADEVTFQDFDNSNGGEAVLWASTCLLRAPTAISTLRLNNLSLGDAELGFLVHALRLHKQRAPDGNWSLAELDLTTNHITCTGAAQVVDALVELGKPGFSVYFDDNWFRTGDTAAFDSACARAAAAEITVSR